MGRCEKIVGRASVLSIFFAFDYSSDRGGLWRHESSTVPLDVVPPAPRQDERAFLVAHEFERGQQRDVAGQGRERQYRPRQSARTLGRLRGAFRFLLRREIGTGGSFLVARGDVGFAELSGKPRNTAGSAAASCNSRSSVFPSNGGDYLPTRPRRRQLSKGPRRNCNTLRRSLQLTLALRRTIWTARFVSKKWTFPISTSNRVPVGTRSVQRTLVASLGADPDGHCQICRFCWHHIKENLNGLCPACRAPYDDETVEFKAIKPDESVLDSSFPYLGADLDVNSD